MNTKFTADKSSALVSALSQKPIEHIQNLIDTIKPFGTAFSAGKGETLRYFSQNKRQCFLVEKGNVALHRRGDGMVITSESAPFILGVSNQLSKNEQLYVRVLDEVKAVRLPLERFNLIVEKENLWENVAHLLIYTASRVYEHCTLMSQMSSYGIIRYQLSELMNEPASIRLTTTAANYIGSRTYLSRSGIMRILSDLRRAGYITIERGILLSMGCLPDRY